jgi:RHS repeat-associated protein
MKGIYVQQGASLVMLMGICIGGMLFSAYGDYPNNYNYRSHSFSKGVDIGDPVSGNAGMYYFSLPLLNLGGPMPLYFTLYYRMDQWPAEEMYSHFESNLNPVLEWLLPSLTQPPKIQVYLRNGDRPRFNGDGLGNWTLNTGSSIPYVLLETGAVGDYGYYYLLDPAANYLYIFRKVPLPYPEARSNQMVCLYVMDRNGNRHTYTYSGSLIPSRVEDGLGRYIDYTLASGGSYGKLERVTDQAGRSILLTREMIPSDCSSIVLRSVTDPMGNVTTFTYGGCESFETNPIVSVLNPQGNTHYVQTVASTMLYAETYKRVSSQTDAYGNASALSYATGTNRITETRADETIVIYEHFYNDGLPKKITDAAGNSIELAQTANEQIASIKDRIGDSSSFAYHASGKPSSVTNAKGNTISYTYTVQTQTFVNPANSEEVTFTFHNLTRVDYPDNTYETFTHDARGNVLTHIDRAGNTWTFTYNERGQVLTVVNPSGGTISNTYNADATLASRKDSDTGITSFGYDEYKRLNTIAFPDGNAMHMQYDLNNRPTLLSDQDDNTTALSYDANGNLIKITDTEGNDTEYEYDLMDRLVKKTNRLGHVSTLSYDIMSRLSGLTDPTGIGITFNYDTRGWMNAIIQSGETWATAYDNEGIPISHITPLGRVTGITNDSLGLPTIVTDPLDNDSIFSFDSMNRLTGVTDPNNLTTAFSFNSLGLLAGVTLPSGDKTTYAYNALGLLDYIDDLGANRWQFGYTSMGRLQTLTDPLNRKTTYAYDTLGRVAEVDFADDSAVSVTYDAKGNIIRLLYDDGTDLQYQYDGESRLIAANGLALIRDAEGKVTDTQDEGISFTAGYDDAGRLQSVQYNNGLFAVSYSYDIGPNGTGLLARVSDTLSGTQIDLSYDKDQRLRTMTLSNGEVITYTWDDADRLERLQSGNYVDVTLTADPGGRTTALDMIAPIAPVNFIEEESRVLTFDAASQITSSGYAYDGRGRVTLSPEHTFFWNDDSRLTSCDGVTLNYNGLGGLRTRTEDAVTTKYYYNYGIAMLPIVAERDSGAGQFLRYYVWTPGGRLLYMIDATDGNKVYYYHFDQIGNTIALTNSNGDLVDSYAYDPYGRLVAHQGNITQPFTYCGAWGVRQEGQSGVIYQMRERYYHALSSRFISPEPIWPQLDNPKALNPYQYAGADPANYIDPNGLSCEEVNLLEAQRFWQFPIGGMKGYSASKFADVDYVKAYQSGGREAMIAALGWCLDDDLLDSYEQTAKNVIANAANEKVLWGFAEMLGVDHPDFPRPKKFLGKRKTFSEYTVQLSPKDAKSDMLIVMPKNNSRPEYHSIWSDIIHPGFKLSSSLFDRRPVWFFGSAIKRYNSITD